MDNWETCPKCKGTGKQFNVLGLTGIPMMDVLTTAHEGLIAIQESRGMKNICPVCNGKMIINVHNGKPPKD